jgi:hypothetical protein
MDTIEAALKADREALVLAQGAETPKDRQASLENLIARMEAADAQKLYQIRAALHTRIEGNRPCDPVRQEREDHGQPA